MASSVESAPSITCTIGGRYVESMHGLMIVTVEGPRSDTRESGSGTDLAKNGVLPIKMRLFGVRDEELRLVGVGASVCHGEDSAVVELVYRMERRPR